MPRFWLHTNTTRTSGDTPLRVLLSFFGAIFFSLLAAEQRPSWNCESCSAIAYVSLLPSTAFILLAVTLCTYACWLTLVQMRKAQAADRMLECQTLLASFARAFGEARTRGEFTVVATGVLADYARFFGADSLRIEIVEPRTGVTVDEFLATRFPPAILPEVKAQFLEPIPTDRSPEAKITPRFLDLRTEKVRWLNQRRTREVAAAIPTPLGRIAILMMIFTKPRRAFSSDETDLLCSSLSGLVLSAADHCKRKNREDLERRLNHAERVQAVGTLASGVAHEFNNILGALLGYGEMALQHAQDGTQAEHYLQQMMSTARRAELIVSQILTLSRSREQEQRPLNLIEAIRDALPLISASFPELEVTAALKPDEGCKMLGHPMDLQQVLMNLCKNAFEASSGSVKVEINVDVVSVRSVKSLSLGLLQPGKYVCLRIKDNGQGISPDALPRIFEPFFTTKSTHGGTGLGLAAVHGLVTAMNGRIDVTSEAHRGTVFEIYFPHCAMPPTPISKFFETPRLVLGSGELIATLKPTCCNLPMHEERIAALGYEPVSFADFAALQRWLMTEVADLIVIDLAAIPAGVSVRDIEAISRGTPTIVTSRFGKDVAAHSTIAAHFTHLRDPMSTRALADAIRSSLGEKIDRQRPIVS
ncbi:hypothetical protein FVA81_00450 (plasmid) [Rhizobium sp. WL3]|uniref:ATP-binding protein n=1 Tax=Rhizobium sp. WL3 TaxID=2603277 RepID=UPI0011C1F354|nr:ATP-binding protein [Rhizobium sp. WL3]QEE43163.1 hypothetical protein FVA81_00450 [Rhizobium sp. WL3]